MNILIAVAALLVAAGVAAVFVSLGGCGADEGADNGKRDDGASDGIVYDEAAAHALTSEIYSNSEPWPVSELPESFPVCGDGTVAKFEQCDGFKEIIVAGINREQLEAYYDTMQAAGWKVDREGKTGAVKENVKVSTDIVLYDALQIRIYEFEVRSFPSSIENVPVYQGKNLTEVYFYEVDGAEIYELRYQDDDEADRYCETLIEDGWSRTDDGTDEDSAAFTKTFYDDVNISVIIVKNILFTSVTIHIERS